MMDLYLLDPSRPGGLSRQAEGQDHSRLRQLVRQTKFCRSDHGISLPRSG